MEKYYENRLFRADKLAPTIYRIYQPWFKEGALRAYSYLIVGTKAAVVFDTMYGYGNLCEFVKEITNLPLIVINSHFHGDHAAGDFDFDSVYIHPYDLPGIYTGFVKTAEEHFQRALSVARPDFFDQLKVEDMCRPKPIKAFPCYDGDIIDIGDRKLEIVHVGGHSPGCIVLLDSTMKIGFSGDTCNDNTIISRFPCDTLQEYYIGMNHLKGKVVAAGIEYMYGAHFEAGAETVDEILELLDRIFAGTDDHAVYHVERPVERDVLYAANMAPMYHRIDGKKANIQYAEDTVMKRPYVNRVLTAEDPGARRVLDRY